MSYLPRPDVDRTAQDVDEIYAMAAEELHRALTAVERRYAFRLALLRAYEAGIDAQRESLIAHIHERPTPVPAAPAPEPSTTTRPGAYRSEMETVERFGDPDDPGTLPPGERVRAPTPQAFPLGVSHPHEPKKR